MARANLNFDLNNWLANAQDQFKGLDYNQPGQWPVLPKALAFVGAVLAVLGVGWVMLLSSQRGELESKRNKEPDLKREYQDKLAQAVNLNELKKQRVQVEEYVTQLEKQLPGRAEMDALLSDINQAGLGRGLEFELFKPGASVVKDYYAELPIAIKVTGRFHDVGAFASDIANLSRIVTLHDLNITSASKDKAAGGGTLVLEATARTYRYLDPQEIQAQKQAQEGDKKGDKKGSKKKGKNSDDKEGGS